MRMFKFMLFVGVFMLCQFMTADNPDHNGVFPVAIDENEGEPKVNIQINTLGLNYDKEREDQKWYQIRWVAKSCPSEENSKQGTYNFGGELDALEAVVTVTDFMEWPKDKTKKYTYNFDCDFIDTTQTDKPRFAYVTIILDCYWDNDVPKLRLSSRGKLLDRAILDFFDVTVSKEDVITSVSVDTIQENQKYSNKHYSAANLK